MANTLDLENLTLEELEEIQIRIKDILNTKKADLQPKLLVYTHRCKNESNYHLRKYKHWAKLVKQVDTTKTNGYAFIGEFLNVNYEHKVPIGSIVVEACQGTIIAYKTTPEGMEIIDTGYSGKLSYFIDKIAELM